jgi:hypothetical protein
VLGNDGGLCLARRQEKTEDKGAAHRRGGAQELSAADCGIDGHRVASFDWHSLPCGAEGMVPLVPPKGNWCQLLE